MDVIIIRHGESHYNFGTTQGLDSQLTELGMKQCCITVDWLMKNVELRDFKAMCSPYLRCLQTASVITEMTRIPIEVHDDLGELHLASKKMNVIGGGATIPNRSILFSNLKWVNWNVESKFFGNERISQFVDRVAEFTSKLTDKVLLVTHAVTHKIICDLLTSRTAEEIKSAWKSPVTFMNETAIYNCGITIVANGELLCFNKAAWSKE
jgi:broad specificity phosphatase PhoE